MKSPDVDESLEFLRSYISRPGPSAGRPLSSPPAGLFRTPKPSLQNYHHQNLNYYAASPPGTLLATSPPQTSSLDTTELLGVSRDTHEQKLQFQAVVSFLRKRYAADPNEQQLPLATLEDDDVSGLLECFGRELRSTVHKEKNRQAQIREGNTSKRVNFAPSEILNTSVSIPAKTSGGSSTAGSTPSSSTKKNSVSLHSSSNNVHEDDEVIVVTPSIRSRKRLLKESLKMMRKGDSVIKFSSQGKPQRRFLRVMDRRATVDGEAVVVPHLCWSATSDADPGNSQLSLLSLQQVSHKKLSSVVPREKDDLVRGESGEAISMDCCVSVSFERRGSLDLAFRSADTAKQWFDGFMAIIAKNNERGASSYRGGNDDDD